MRILVPVVRGPYAGYMVSPHFGMAEAYLILDADEQSCRIVTIVPAPPHQPGGRGRILVQVALQYGVQAVVASMIGRGAYEALTSNGIKVYHATSQDPCEAAKAVIKGAAREFMPSEVHEGRRGGGYGWRHGWREW